MSSHWVPFSIQKFRFFVRWPIFFVMFSNLQQILSVFLVLGQRAIVVGDQFNRSFSGIIYDMNTLANLQSCGKVFTFTPC